MLIRLSGDTKLLEMFEKSNLEFEKFKQTVINYFEFLYKIAIKKARKVDISITTIVLMFLHYFIEKKNKIDFNRKYYDLKKYFNYYFYIMYKV